MVLEKGTVMPPKHILELILQLLDVDEQDYVFASCAGQGIFLRRCMDKGAEVCGCDSNPIFCEKLHTEGIEAITEDFLQMDQNRLKKKPTVGFINPPYGLGSEKAPDYYELRFVEKLLDVVAVGGL